MNARVESMFKRNWRMLAILLTLCTCQTSRAQAVRYDNIILGRTGQPAAGISVAVCTQPANLTTQPCSPLATLYTDTTAAVQCTNTQPYLPPAPPSSPCTNPMKSDGLGNYHFYITPGTYTIQFFGAGTAPPTALQDQAIGGSGGGASPAGNNGDLQMKNGTALAASAINDNGTSIAVNEDIHFKGPNPYLDVTRYGIRSIPPNTAPAVNGITANCVNGNTSVVISAASIFINGDGVNLFGCGNPHALATPGAPTVTPSVARTATGIGEVVNSPAGATTYNYQIIARTKGGGLTAASVVGTTAAGQASLGSQSVAISTMTRANDVVTVTTSSAHTLAVGSLVYIKETAVDSINDITFAGWYQVATAADTTHFTFLSGTDTRNGGPPTWVGSAGTVFWFNCNHISWTAVPNAYQYYIYGRTGGSLTLLGVSKPNNPANASFTDGTLYWDDFGSPMMDGTGSLPAFVPNTPPSVATSDNLVTTIASGAGTTTLVLSVAPGTTSTGATIRFDNAPNILTLATNNPGKTIYFPTDATYATLFVNNSILDLSSIVNPPTQIAGAGLILYETMILSTPHWQGKMLPQTSNNNASFQGESLPVNSCRATPCVFATNGTFGFVEGLVFSTGGGSANNALLWLQDNGSANTAAQYSRMNFITGSGTTDYMGKGFECRGYSLANCSAHFYRVLFEGGPFAAADGTDNTPQFYCNLCGQMTLDKVTYSRRANVYKIASSGTGAFQVAESYTQGLMTPFLTIFNGSGGVLGSSVTLRDVTLDTSFHPLISIQGGANTYSGTIAIGPQTTPNGSGMPSISGFRAIGIVDKFPGPNGGLVTGQNRDAIQLNTGFAVDGIYASLGGAVYSSTQYNQALNVGNAYPIFVSGAPITNLSVAVAAGGNVPVGTHTYKIVPVWQNNAEGVLSNQSNSCITSGGNLTCNLSWTAASGNCKGYNVYRDGALLASTSPAVVGCATATYSDIINSAFGSSIISFPAGGPTMLMPGTQGVSTPNLVLNGPGGFNSTLSAGALTANRTISAPDVSGAMVLTGNANMSAYDNFNRANGAIGSNWTTQAGTINVSSNTIVPTVGGSNAAFWNATAFGTDQFSEATIATMGANAPGVAARMSVVGANFNLYACIENTTTMFFQRILAGSSSLPTSSGVTGAAGDVLRIEVVGTTIKCYQNGNLILTTSDSNLTSGSPGVQFTNNNSALDNWSGGNIHPIAQLDLEQDWVQPQHFTQPITVGNTAPVAGALPAGSIITSGNHEMLGVACTNGELALSGGWQLTGAATVTAVVGKGQTCSWTITTGTTTGANPTITDTLTNALSTAATVCEMNIHGGTHTAVVGEYFNQTTLSATAPVFTANFTPTAGGTTYFVTRSCGP